MKQATIVLALILTGTMRPAAGTDAVRLTNEFWQITIEPTWGGRASSLRARKLDYEFVLHSSVGRDGTKMTGGAFVGHMSGSYASEQIQSASSVTAQGPDFVSMAWTNPHQLFDGLREERTVRLAKGDPRVVLSIKIVNTATEDRVVSYRLHDLIGTGAGMGADSIYVVGDPAGSPTVYAAGPLTPSDTHFIHPAQPWFALVDLPGDAGLFVEVRESPLQSIFFWKGGAQRTAELFFPRVKLAPGAAWEFEARYTPFRPSAPKTLATRADGLPGREAIVARLAACDRSIIRAGLPMDARFAPPTGDAPVTLVPVHPFDTTIGSGAALYEGGLVSIRLAGTPGARVPLAFAVRARTAVASGAVSFGPLTAGARTIPPSAYDARYVSRNSWKFLVRDWDLARRIPENISRINNDVRDADTLTPFSLAVGEEATLWANLTIPATTKPGVYEGPCRVRADAAERSFVVSLTVHPFTVKQAANKARGSFFRYDLKRGPDDDRPTAISREEYRRALADYFDVGYNSAVIYVAGRQDLLWVLDTCVDLGVRNGTLVLIIPDGVSQKEFDARYGQYGYRMLAWTVDEPSRYGQIPLFLKRYRARRDQGYVTTFTPNMPPGLILSDLFGDIVPIVSLTGTAPFVLDFTREYARQGRDVYWYCMPFHEPTALKRLERSVYLWREPVEGILDWGEDSWQEKPASMMAGFSGTRPIPTVAREHVRQAYIDLDHLTMLESLTATAPPSAVRDAAAGFLDWLRIRHSDNFKREGARIGNPRYFDDLRATVAEFILRLHKAGR